jgi:hypothetical protein
MKGSIKLHRAIVNWEWYSDPNTMRVFIHCLLKANSIDSEFKGVTIKRGSFITGRAILSKELGLTPQQVRTVLNKLKNTEELNITSTTRGTLIEVVNYNTYQVDDTPAKPIKKEAGKSVEEREIKFRDSLVPYVSQYGKQMIRQFFDYWSEMSPRGKKMRFEKEKVFDIKKRLVTWSSKDWNKTQITKGDDDFTNHVLKQMRK